MSNFTFRKKILKHVKNCYLFRGKPAFKNKKHLVNSFFGSMNAFANFKQDIGFINLGCITKANVIDYTVFFTFIFKNIAILETLGFTSAGTAFYKLVGVC